MPVTGVELQCTSMVCMASTHCAAVDGVAGASVVCSTCIVMYGNVWTAPPPLKQKPAVFSLVTHSHLIYTTHLHSRHGPDEEGFRIGRHQLVQTHTEARGDGERAVTVERV